MLVGFLQLALLIIVGWGDAFKHRKDLWHEVINILLNLFILANVLAFTNYGTMNLDPTSRHAWGLAFVFFVLGHFCFNYIPLAVQAWKNLKVAKI